MKVIEALHKARTTGHPGDLQEYGKANIQDDKK
jgi:hypothetical protein